MHIQGMTFDIDDITLQWEIEEIGYNWRRWDRGSASRHARLLCIMSFSTIIFNVVWDKKLAAEFNYK